MPIVALVSGSDWQRNDRSEYKDEVHDDEDGLQPDSKFLESIIFLQSGKQRTWTCLGSDCMRAEKS